MKILEKTDQRPVMSEPQMTFIVMSIIFMVIGGIILYRFNTHPHVLIIDKQLGLLQIKAFQLDHIVSIYVDNTIMQFKNGPHRVFNINARLKVGATAELVPYYIREKQHREDADIIRVYLSLNDTPFSA